MSKEGSPDGDTSSCWAHSILVWIFHAELQEVARVRQIDRLVEWLQDSCSHYRGSECKAACRQVETVLSQLVLRWVQNGSIMAHQLTGTMTYLINNNLPWLL